MNNEQNCGKTRENKIISMLENATYSRQLLDEMKQTKSELYAHLGAAGVSPDRLRPSNRNYTDSKVERLVLRAEMIDKRILDETSRIVKIMNCLTELINKLPEYRHRLVIIKKYIDNKTIEQIAEEMGYSARHTQRLLNDSVRLLTQLYEKYDLADKNKHSSKT